MDPGFIKKLVKGKIVEIIFWQMFADSGEFDIIPLGYEYQQPTLTQLKHSNPIVQDAVAGISSLPDFLLVTKDDSAAFVVEVKYRFQPELSEIIEIAKEIVSRHKHAWLFLASSDMFYFSPCHDIIREAKLTPLTQNWVDSKTQDICMDLLNRHIPYKH